LYYQNSATNFAASSYKWFKENFFTEVEENLSDHEDIYSYINKQIEAIKVGAEGLLFHPYLNGERSPHWDPYLKGSFFGITARHERAHFARAVLEGVGYSLREAAEEFKSIPESPIKIIGGGAKDKTWPQIMANILNRTLEIPETSDSSFGTCLIAATSIGWYSDLKTAVKQTQKLKFKVYPQEKNVQTYNKLYSIYKDFYKQTKLLSHQLTDIAN